MPLPAVHEDFRAWLNNESSRIAQSGQVKILSAVPDTPATTTHRTLDEAIGLMRSAADRTARVYLPVVQKTPMGSMEKYKGEGFFTEGNSTTGEWNSQQGFFWTGGFWTGELWKLYSSTHDAKYRQLAETWNAQLLGLENKENHDTGFLNYYSSVFAWEATKDPKYREGGLRAAARLKELYNPLTGLIASWGVNGDDTIIDTMMWTCPACLQTACPGMTLAMRASISAIGTPRQPLYSPADCCVYRNWNLINREPPVIAKRANGSCSR